MVNYIKRFQYFVSSELSVFHVRYLLAQFLLAPLPPFVGNSIRWGVMRLLGFQIGRRTQLFDVPRISGPHNIYKKLSIGSHCIISVQIYIDLGAKISIGDRSVLGPQCMLITGTHETSAVRYRSSSLTTKPICIGSGVWLGARTTILPGVTIGDGAVVAAGSVVNRDIPPYTLAAGVPAVVKRNLERRDQVRDS